MSKTTQHFLLTLSSGLLLGLAWPTNGITFLIFVALVPLFYLEESIRNDNQKRKGFRLFGYSYLTFLIWNLITTWWLINSTVFGMLFANLCNSLFYALLFTCFFWAKGRLPYRSSYWFLISIWLAFEKLHLLWDFSWSWLNLGNVFSEKIYWIQWYEYTGTFGGSFWVLSLNIWLYFTLNSFYRTRSFKSLTRKIVFPLLAIALPIAFSLYLYQGVEAPKKSIEVIMVQPNIDPYDEKYRLTNSVLSNQLFEQIQPHLSSSTDYILAPETYFAEGYGEELKNFSQTTLHQKLQQQLAEYPKTQLITGIQFYDVFIQEEAPSLTANLARKGLWIEYYNSALAESNKENPNYYHKSKLVVGVENMPFKSILNPLLGDVMLDLGGTVASRVTQKNRSVFTHPILQEKAAPIICWESIFGEFVTGYIKEGATFLAVLSNDAWWGETPGHRQLLSYTRLRAIETRRDIARSANTGISCVINAKGELFQPTDYNTQTVLKAKIAPRTTLTFYTRFGDLIARWATLIFGLYFLIAISGRLKPKSEL